MMKDVSVTFVVDDRKITCELVPRSKASIAVSYLGLFMHSSGVPLQVGSSDYEMAFIDEDVSKQIETCLKNQGLNPEDYIQVFDTPEGQEIAIYIRKGSIVEEGA